MSTTVPVVPQNWGALVKTSNTSAIRMYVQVGRDVDQTASEESLWLSRTSPVLPAFASQPATIR